MNHAAHSFILCALINDLIIVTEYCPGLFPHVYLNLEYFPTNTFRVTNFYFQETVTYKIRQQIHKYGNVQHTSADVTMVTYSMSADT